MPQSDKFINPTVLLFTGADCAPCKAVKPTVKTAAIRHNWTFVEVPVEDEPSETLVKQYGVTSVPVMILRDDTGVLDHRAQGMPAILGALKQIQ